MEILILLIPILTLILGYLLIKSKTKYKKLEKESEEFKLKYEPILDIEVEVEKKKESLSKIKKDIREIKKSYSEKRAIYDDLTKQLSLYEEDLALTELGFYKPRFALDDSEKYKREITKNRDKQKVLMSNKTAITASQEWTVDGSKTKGKAMINKTIKLVARAFNNECDVIISKVKWSNLDSSENRMRKMYDTINKLVENQNVSINYDYLSLKIDELILTHEYREKQQDEKEEQAQIRQQMREEAQLIQEIEKAEKEEDKYAKLLAKAKLDAEKATGEKLSILQSQIAQLQIDLIEAHKKNERAKSMAQQTRAGHVYIISNIGSFGENIYKIGMTRRLEPLDRVKELGDASVPFLFDVHAMIYSEDAPGMEKNLHNIFNQNRVNLVNNRKEFFNVSLQQIKEEVLKHKGDVEFIETIEAREYTESLSIRASLNQEQPQVLHTPPSSI